MEADETLTKEAVLRLVYKCSQRLIFRLSWQSILVAHAFLLKKRQFSLIPSFLLEYYNVQSSDKHLKTFQQTIEVGDIAMLCENNEWCYIHLGEGGVVVVVVVGGFGLSIIMTRVITAFTDWSRLTCRTEGIRGRATTFIDHNFDEKLLLQRDRRLHVMAGVDSHRDLITQLMARRPRVRQALNWILISQRILTIYCFRGRKMWNYDLLHMITLAPSCIENVEAIESDCCGIGLAFLQLVCIFWKPTLPPCSLPLLKKKRKMKISPFTRTFLFLSWYEIPSPCVNGKEMWVAST